MANDSSNGDDTSPSFDPGISGQDDRSIDKLFGALADRRTRYVVYWLESQSVTVIELDTLADSVAELEVEAELADDFADHRQKVPIDLHHKILPKLDDAGVLDYDSRLHTIRYWDDERMHNRISASLELFHSERNL